MSAEAWDGKTGLLRQVLADTAQARAEVAVLGERVDGMASDHRELKDEVRDNYASLHKSLAENTRQLRFIHAWAAGAGIGVVGTAVAIAYLLSKIPPTAWASLLK